MDYNRPMNLDYPNLDYPFGPRVELFPEAAAAVRHQRSSQGTAVAAAPAHPVVWRYPILGRRRSVLAFSLAISASVHGILLFGFNHHVKPHPKVAPPQIEVELQEMPKIKDLDEPDQEPGERTDEVAGVEAPQLPDLPGRVDLDRTFVQQMDVASLTASAKVDGAKLASIPTMIHHGGTGAITTKLKDVFNLADLDRPPSAVFQAAPVVPGQLRREGITTRVFLEFIVNTKGEVVEPRVIRTDSPDFDDVAIRAVLKWKFKPGYKQGRAVNTRIQQPMVFSFEDEPGKSG